MDDFAKSAAETIVWLGRMYADCRGQEAKDGMKALEALKILCSFFCGRIKPVFVESEIRNKIQNLKGELQQRLQGGDPEAAALELVQGPLDRLLQELADWPYHPKDEQQAERAPERPAAENRPDTSVKSVDPYELGDVVTGC